MNISKNLNISKIKKEDYIRKGAKIDATVAHKDGETGFHGFKRIHRDPQGSTGIHRDSGRVLWPLAFLY